MINNRKNRKLKFIRNKNSLRLGITKFYCIEKVSNFFDDKTEFYWKRLIDIAYKSLYKNYRLKLHVIIIETDLLSGDDFIKNMHTNRVTLSRN